MNIEILIDEPVCIFKTKDALINEKIDVAKRSFPDDLNRFQCDVHGKHRIENASLEMAVLRKLEPWKTIFAAFSGKSLDQLLNSLPISSEKYAAVSLNPFVNFYHLIIKKKTLVTTSFEFSTLFEGAQLVPHTDSKNKIITLMMYFPSETQEGRMDLGTVFHKFNQAVKQDYTNFDNLHYTPELFPDFYSDHKEIMRVPFTSYDIHGFVKGAYSWHSLPSIELEKGERRNSLNINCYLYKHSIFSLLTEKFKMEVKLLLGKFLMKKYSTVSAKND